MTIMLTDEAQTIVAHFTQHMPIGVRAAYKEKVIDEMRKHELDNHHDDYHPVSDELAMQATRACVNVMWMMWSQARANQKDITSSYTLGEPRGGRSSTNLAATQ